MTNTTMALLSTTSWNTTSTSTTKSTKNSETATVAPSSRRNEETPLGIYNSNGANTEETASERIWDRFDIEAFRSQVHHELLDAIGKTKEDLKKNSDMEWVSDILYAVDDKVEAAEVPEYWNAENTSQRIVDFAMSFRGLASELNDEEYVEYMRSAIEEGFKQAKGMLGGLPGPSAKLFNDTYELTMKKLDEYFQDADEVASDSSVPTTEVEA